MTIVDFIAAVQEELKASLREYFPELEVVKAMKVDKLQGQSYTGLALVDKSLPGGPVIDVGKYYREYKDKKEDAIKALVSDAKEAMDLAKKMFAGPEQLISDYRLVKDKLLMQAVRTEGNEAVLDGAPHFEIADMSFVYRVNVGEESGLCGSAIVTNALLEVWEVTEEQLREDAESAMMDSVVDMPIEEAVGACVDEDGRSGCYVLTNREKYLGAGVLGIRGILRSEALKLGVKGFYVLPSSIHEVLLIDDSTVGDVDVLSEAVLAVSGLFVLPEEVLTHSVYHYDFRKDKFEIVR